MKIGYARVSTDDQNLSLQLDALAAAGCDKVFQDQVSGAAEKRPGLDAALAAVQPGDVLTVWRLDRLAASVISYGHSLAYSTQKNLQGKEFKELSERSQRLAMAIHVIWFVLFIIAWLWLKLP